VRRPAKTFCFVLIVMLLLGSWPLPTAAEVGATRTGPPPAKPEGEVDVYVNGGEKWIAAGSFYFDEFPREAALVLPAGAESPVRLQLIRTGGGVAHLDAVLLDGAEPEWCSAEEISLIKLALRDNDLVNFPAEGLEIGFPAGGYGSVFKITARIEPEVTSPIPFHFPVENTYYPVTEASSFYHYQMNDIVRAPGPDGMADLITGLELLFQEFIVPGSGHPAGYVYGWVYNDNQNLYAALDFTCDNTVDGEKDYAKLYVQTPQGIKEFKVTAATEEWGKARFIYTEKAEYQHKFYEFSIPLAELGVVSGSRQIIPVAFAAYGTAGPPNRRPSVAYNSTDNTFLAAYYDSFSDGNNLTVQLLDNEGEILKTANIVPAHEDYAYGRLVSVNYCLAENGFLLVWQNNEYIDDVYDCQIMACLVEDLDNGPTWSKEITPAADNADGSFPAAVYDNNNECFLVVWRAINSAGDYQICSRLIAPDGSLGEAITVASPSESLGRPVVGFAGEKYLVAYTEWNSSDNCWNLKSQLLNEDGALSGDVQTLAEDIDVYNIDLVYNEANYLVVYEDGNECIRGRHVDSDGALAGGHMELADQGEEFTLAYDSCNDRYFLAWAEDNYSDGYMVYGRFFSLDGTPDGEVFAVSSGDSEPAGGYSVWERYPDCAVNSRDGSILVGYEDGWQDVEYIIIEDPSALRVVSTDPADASTVSEPPAEITVRFNKDIGIGGEGELFDDININYGDGSEVDCGASIAADTLIITPESPLAYGVTYTVTIPDWAVVDKDSEEQTIGYEFWFAVAEEPVLEIISTSPADNARNVSVNPLIKIVFNEAVIIPAGGEHPPITLAKGETPVPFTLSVAGNELRLKPASSLSYETKYIVSVPVGSVEDEGGGTLEAAYAFSFTTTRSLPSGGGSSTSSSMPGNLQFGWPGYTVKENDRSLRVSVERTGGSDGTVTVQYATADGTAKAGEDYTETTGVLTFAPGEKEKAIEIPITLDNINEPAEDFRVLLKEPAGGAGLGAHSEAAVTIENTLVRIIMLTVDKDAATIDGEPYALDAAPYIIPEAARALIPLRFVSEGLYTYVDWVQSAMQVRLEEGATEIILTVGSNVATVDGSERLIDCPTELKPPGRVFVPLRFVSETFGATVNWDQNTGVITIIKFYD
jgi:methionine-rich copper-binding protein CopC